MSRRLERRLVQAEGSYDRLRELRALNQAVSRIENNNLPALVKQRDANGLKWYQALATVAAVAGERYDGYFGSYVIEVAQGDASYDKEKGIVVHQAVIARESLKLLTQAIDERIDEDTDAAQTFRTHHPSLLWEHEEDASQLSWQTQVVHAALSQYCHLGYYSDHSPKDREAIVGMLRRVRLEIAQKALLSKIKRYGVSSGDFLDAWDKISGMDQYSPFPWSPMAS